MDSCFDSEMKKLCNWLLFGLSTTDIHGSVHKEIYSDCFFVISKDGLQAYITSGAFKEFSKLTTLVSNCNIYCLTKSDENDQEKQEVIKVSRFYEMVHDKKVIGMPTRKVNGWMDPTSEMQMVEKWPIIQAYGLDMVGGGFFTMKHNFSNVRDQLDEVYKEYDAFSKYRIVNEEIERINSHFFDNFFSFNRDTLAKRQQRTEHELIEALYQRYQYSLMQRKSCDFSEEDANDGLPISRVLIGQNTNKANSEASD